MADVREALLEAGGEALDALGGPRSPELSLVVERLGQRPPVLEGVEAAGSECGAGRDLAVPRDAALDPGDVGADVKRRDRRPERVPGLDAPHQAGAPGAAEPLVAAGDEHVHRLDPDRLVLDAEGVHAVDREQHAVAPVGAHRGGDLRERELDAGARVHPREREHAGAAGDAGPDGLRDRAGGGLGGVVVELDAPERQPVAGGPQPQRLVGRVVVVLGGEELVATGAQVDRPVHEAEPHRRRVGEREVLRVDLQVPAAGLGDRGVRSPNRDAMVPAALSYAA